MDLTHLKNDNQIKMVDVSRKDKSERMAIASGKIYLKESTIDAIYDNEIKKGNVLTTAQVAGIMALKKTADLIPLTHNISVTDCDIEFNRQKAYLECKVSAKTLERTGIEMEVIVAVSIALTTIYDMCKAVDKEMVISDIKLEYKSGGRSGEYVRQQ